VANELVNAGMAGAFDFGELPSCPKNGEVSRYDINITNEEFIELRTVCGAKSKKLSLRRVLYWFVDTEAWETLNLEAKSKLIQEKTIKYISRASNIAEELVKLTKEVPQELKPNVLNAIRELKEVLKNA